MKPEPEREPKYFHFKTQGRPLKETVTLLRSKNRDSIVIVREKTLLEIYRHIVKTSRVLLSHRAIQ